MCRLAPALLALGAEAEIWDSEELTVRKPLRDVLAGPGRTTLRSDQHLAEACIEAVRRSIPGRYSLPCKRLAALALAYDAWNALQVCPPCERIVRD